MSKKIFFFLSFQYFLFLTFNELLLKSQQTRIYVLEILLFSLVCVFKRRQLWNTYKQFNGAPFLRILLFFMMIGAVYLAFSYNNFFTKYWHLYSLDYNASFIPRHFFIVAQFFISVGLGYCLYKSNFLLSFNNKYVIAVFAGLTLFFVGMNFSDSSRTYSSFIVLLVSLLSVNQKRYVFLPLFLIPFFIEFSSYTIGLLILIFIIFYMGTLSKMLEKHGMLKVSFFVLFVMILMMAYSTLISEKIDEDVNSAWRLVVWTNEIRTLIRTQFTGVGFGTAYVTIDILQQTDNVNMYLKAENGFSEGIFIIANHNSILNTFYRMGLLGGLTFLVLNLSLFSWFLKVNHEPLPERVKRYLWWAMANYLFNFVIISLNPGLEMLQFSIGYQLSMAIIIYTLLYSSKMIRLSKKVSINASGSIKMESH